MNMIRQIALWINVAIWTVVGFLCWIPLLMRTTATLAAAILVSTITQSDPTHLKINFENAVSFYSRGYQTIYRVLGTDTLPSWGDGVAVAKPEIKWDRVLLEIIWTAIFWTTFVFSVYGFFNWSLT